MLNFFLRGGVLLREMKNVCVLHTIPQCICKPLHFPFSFEFLFYVYGKFGLLFFTLLSCGVPVK